MQKATVISEFFDGKIPCFGVAGNFTGHLEQAGEAQDFENVKTATANAPKAVFPTYLPVLNGNEGVKNPATPEFLHVFPFNKNEIVFPKGEQKLQIEPECAIIFDAVWNGEKLVDLIPFCFGASNDCSIRKEGAKKISQKKNWCNASKGFNPCIKVNGRLQKECIINNYRIASFLVRNNQAFEYGEDSAICDYSYMNETLINWLLEKFNSQKDEGPAENIHSYLVESGCPSKIMVSIGATRYTSWGEHNFLQLEDDAVVVVYPKNYSFEQIKLMVEKGESTVAQTENESENKTDSNISILRQKIK